jgi:predicted phage-related endonuclease
MLPPLEVFDCEQGSQEWFNARCAVVTASEFATVLAKGLGGGESVTRRKYLLTLAGEAITGEVADKWEGNRHTERGKLLEPEARDAYALITGADPVQVGFMRRGGAGASPDSLVGDDGLLEIKTKLPHLQLECLESDRLPPEHVAQVQGQLWISGREWCDFVSYWPGLPIFIKRVERDEAYIAGLSVAVNDFIAEMAAIVNKYTRRGAA